VPVPDELLNERLIQEVVTMILRNFPVIPSVADSLLSDRFGRIDRLFSQLTGDSPVSMTPPYDLKQLDNERYTLTVSVPGWQDKELEIEVSGGHLTVSGCREDNTGGENETAGGGHWLHRGIIRADFRLSYSVPEHIKVTEARLRDGLLCIGMRLEVPESEKPRRIPIESQEREAIEHYVT
jgi:molecular chaperone IbpA